MTLLIALRSLVFYLGYLVSLIIYSTFCVLTGWMLPVEKRYAYFLYWNRFAIWWLCVSCSIKISIKGQENIPTTPFILASNHQSPWETIYFAYYFQPISPILKRELLNIPFFGWGLRMLKPIAIDRSKKRSARQTILTEGCLRVKSGFSVMVFPEGTRLNPGAYKKYSPGAAELAINSNVSILPVVHNAGKYWPSKRFLKFPGTIEVIIGTPFDTSDALYNEPRALTQSLDDWSREALQHLS